MKAHDSASFTLHFGPYRTPRCRIGTTLECEARGRTVVVAGISDAAIQWPYAKRRGNRSLILCGDLIKAVALESETAVAHHWGVSASTVYTWRRALGVSRNTIGSVRLIRHYIGIGRENSRLPESRAKMSAAQARRPPCPQFREAGLEAAKRPKSEAWKKALSERLKREWATGVRRKPFRKSQGTA
jgi:transposase-like protein